MPRNVRNWWIEGQPDQGTRTSFGPRGSAEGFELTIFQRDSGSVSTALRIRGHATHGGQLILTVEDDHGKVIQEVRSER